MALAATGSNWKWLKLEVHLLVLFEEFSCERKFGFLYEKVTLRCNMNRRRGSARCQTDGDSAHALHGDANQLCISLQLELVAT